MATLIKIKCEECKSVMNGHKFTSHLKQYHQMSQEAYYKTHLQLNPKEGTCIHCTKPTTFVSVFRGYRTYCSAVCCSMFRKSSEPKIVKARLLAWRKRIRLYDCHFEEPKRYGLM